MKKFLVVFLLFSILCSFGQSQPAALSIQLDEYFTALTDLKNFNGNVLIAQNGKILLEKSYNMAGESDSLMVSKESRFIIASVSKVFIKMGILKLVEMKRLQLADKLSKFIPDFPNGEKIQIKHLLHHQSGLPRELHNIDASTQISLAKVVELAKLEKLQFEPGTQVLYSNIGYFLLHYLIETRAKQGYVAFIQKEIFRKMQILHTNEFNSTKLPPHFVYGFENRNGKVVASDAKSISQFETGNYFSTIEDLYAVSEKMLAGKVLKKALMLQLFEPDSILAQAGGRPGYRAYFYKNLKMGITFIFLANYTEIPFQETTKNILNILNHQPYEIPHKIHRTEIALSTEILNRYVGKYALVDDVSQVYSIELREGKLFQVEPDGTKLALHPDTETTFFENPDTQDGYIFTFNPTTEKYELSLISTGVNYKTKRIE